MSFTPSRSLFVVSLVLTLTPPGPAALRAQQQGDLQSRIRAVADAVVRNTTFHFVDRKSGERFDSPMKAPSDADLQPESPSTDWRYWNGVLIIGMMRLGEVLGDTTYTNFALRDIAFNFNNYRYFAEKYHGQRKWDYPFGQHIVMEELDDCGAMGASVIEVYRRVARGDYRSYIDQAANYIRTKQHRLADGTFVRAFPEKWTLWADDLYMSVVFLSRMGELTKENRYFDDAALQVINFNKYLFDVGKGLMSHYWYSDVGRAGVAFWGRANGWALLAQVDLLDRIPNNHPQRDTLLALFRRHILGVARYQSADGLWHQLLDKEDSYLETSCTAMFTFAVARAVRERYLESRYASIAQRGWEGLLSKIQTDGLVEGVCAGTGVGNDLVFYYHRPTPVNDPHGIGPILLAGAGIIDLPR